jgi:DNA-binding MarR family transcriptional regulator
LLDSDELFHYYEPEVQLEFSTMLETAHHSRLGHALLRLGDAAKRLALAGGEPFGLTSVQAQTILFCGRTRPDLASVGNLARILGTTHATAVGVVDGLVRRGLLQRRTKPEDRRITLLELTAGGRDAFRAIVDAEATLDGALGRLTADQRAALDEAVAILSLELAAAGHLHFSEPCPGCVFFEPLAAPAAARPHFCRYFRTFLGEAETRLDCPKHTPERDSVADDRRQVAQVRPELPTPHGNLSR